VGEAQGEPAPGEDDSVTQPERPLTVVRGDTAPDHTGTPGTDEWLATPDDLDRHDEVAVPDARGELI
jgi:hypothetical protein